MKGKGNATGLAGGVESEHEDAHLLGAKHLACSHPQPREDQLRSG